MKRSFLHALALCFVIGFLAGSFLIIAGNALAGAPVALTCMLIVVLLLRAAEVRGRSRFLHLYPHLSLPRQWPMTFSTCTQ
jgi:hypothetical protein